MEIIIHPRNAALAEDFREIALEKLETIKRFKVIDCSVFQSALFAGAAK